MEVLYSTGIRRHELAGLDVFDIDAARGTLTVRQGKGRKDRTVPIGEHALAWVARYLDEARPALVAPPETPALFLSERGDRPELQYLTTHARRYVDGAKLGKHRACQIFRHSIATLMLEGGADIRHIQEILGHAETSTTAIDTRVSIVRLKQVHDATHPGRQERAEGRAGASGRRRGAKRPSRRQRGRREGPASLLGRRSRRRGCGPRERRGCGLRREARRGLGALAPVAGSLLLVRDRDHAHAIRENEEDDLIRQPLPKRASSTRARYVLEVKRTGHCACHDRLHLGKELGAEPRALGLVVIVASGELVLSQARISSFIAYEGARTLPRQDTPERPPPTPRRAR
jgi:hypothetical protein